MDGLNLILRIAASLMFLAAVVCFFLIREKYFVAGEGATRRGTNEGGQTGGQVDIVPADARLAGDEREDTSRGEP